MSTFTMISAEQLVASDGTEQLPEVLVISDGSGPLIDASVIHEFALSRDDAWVPGFETPDEPDLFRFAEPLQIYRLLPSMNVEGAVSWRLDARITLLRTRLWRALGPLERGFASAAGALRELGLRWLSRGAIPRQRPDKLGTLPSPHLPLSDRYRTLMLQRSTFWSRYVLGRRLMQGASPLAETRAFRAAFAGGPRSVPPPPIGAASRPLGDVRHDAHVTVVLPTFGRYPYVVQVLEDLRAQSIKPHQIVIADGNAPADRQPEIYNSFADLPLEVFYPEQQGTCVPRNECLRRATGDFIWFVDDDSRFQPDNLEQHLRVLDAYGADVSVGPAYTRERSELHASQAEIRCSWMDCGTTLVRRTMIDRVGGFDLQFNERLAGEDGEMGIRFIHAGGVMVSNPLAKRFHYCAPVGGARASSNNIHRWRRFALLPRPNQSLYYTGARYFDPVATREAVFQAWTMLGWRRPDAVAATTAWRAKTFIAEAIALPVSLIRLARSVHAGRRMAQQGPSIPSVDTRTRDRVDESPATIPVDRDRTNADR